MAEHFDLIVPGAAARAQSPMTATSHPTFPDGARMHTELRLVTWHPHGVLDAPLAREILRFIEAQEQSATEPFDRFADLSGLEGIHLSFAEVEQLAQDRIECYHGAPVKSAIFALNPLAFGMARMYEQLMRRSPIEVGVFHEVASAAAWLNIPVGVLAAVD